jgi:tRNA(adenine34) deaminase
LTGTLKEALMREALHEASLASLAGEVPAGAIVASPDGRVLARGRNRVIELSDPTAHAEILAIREAGRRLANYRLEGLILVSTLEPCAMCLSAALHARFMAVVFGAPEPKWGAAGSLLDLNSVPGMNHRLELLEGGVLASECAGRIVEFFRGRRRLAAVTGEAAAENAPPGQRDSAGPGMPSGPGEPSGHGSRLGADEPPDAGS